LTAFIDIRDVTHSHAGAEDGASAVQHLNLIVNEGGFAAIVGPSGCGKSTLMKLTAGLRFPRKGTVIVGGKQVGARVKLAGLGVIMDAITAYIERSMTGWAQRSQIAA
jgi:NitT/TauT family transport system ATP-binding protein